MALPLSNDAISLGAAPPPKSTVADWNVAPPPPLRPRRRGPEVCTSEKSSESERSHLHRTQVDLTQLDNVSSVVGISIGKYIQIHGCGT